MPSGTQATTLAFTYPPPKPCTAWSLCSIPYILRTHPYQREKKCEGRHRKEFDRLGIICSNSLLCGSSSSSISKGEGNSRKLRIGPSFRTSSPQSRRTGLLQ